MSKQQKPVQPVAVETEGGKIWNEIKDLPISMFSLSNQKVSDFCEPRPIEPSRCFLVIKAGSVLPALEVAIGNKFVCELADKYVIVSRNKNGVV